MAQDDYRTHRAPYYGGEKFHRTLQEAFGPYTNHVIHPTERPSLLRRVSVAAFNVLLALALIFGSAALVALLVAERVMA